MNIIAFMHAYKFTHFTNNDVTRTKTADKLSMMEKIGILFFGVNNPRPVNKTSPSQKFETFRLQSNKMIECWSIKKDSSKGTVILFHGYGGDKSLMLDKSDEFLKMGFSTILVDFMGSGGSEGNQTTIGYKESEEVKTVFDHLSKTGEKNIYLFGTSLGAAAILKSIDDYQLLPKGIMIECPFGSMYETTCARFRSMNVPTFPMAGLLVFWGGIQNGFWAFSHNPTKYAKSVQSPTLLMYGAKDERVSRKEIDEIFNNLQGEKYLSIYTLAGHENYLNKYKDHWVSDVQKFIQRVEQ